MKVLITGASGFLGTALKRVLVDRGMDVTALSSREADLRDGRSLKKFSSVKYNKIFHLASWTQAGDFCLYHPGEQWLINQQINTTVLNWWAASQKHAKLISIGTSCTYEEGSDLREENYLSGTPISDLYVYAMTKRMLQIGLMSLNRQYGMRYLTVVPSTLYGPGYHAGVKQMHFIFDLAFKILRHKYESAEVVLWGDGYQKRELVFVDDFVDALLALDKNVENEVVNIGAGEEHTIREFAGLICEIVGVNQDVIKYDTTKYVGAKSKCLNVEKLNRLLPGRKTVSLRAGLELTLKWMEREHFMKTGVRT